ncbi:MAG TPA: M13-type metalloendopeptidase, partial [Polyangiaceae bacterium]|nr:M13-type metalloendopeptidase [Polyangiaceae bacterium]
DLGGLKLSFAALQRAQGAAPSSADAGQAQGQAVPMPSVGGFTPAQQFFVGFAQAWCANYRPEALRLLVSTNPHSPPKYRVNGPLANLQEFATAFQCKEGSPMVPPAAKRCVVW